MALDWRAVQHKHPSAEISRCCDHTRDRLDCWAQVRILSLDPEDVLGVLALQAVPAVPEALLLIDSPAADVGGKGGDDEGGAGRALPQHRCGLTALPCPLKRCRCIIRVLPFVTSPPL